MELDEKRALHLSQVLQESGTLRSLIRIYNFNYICRTDSCFLQACIGEVEEDSSESICLFVNINGKKLALGTLNSEKLLQQSFDLVFDKTFELSHNWKNGSVFFHGYTADNDISDQYPFLPLFFCFLIFICKLLKFKHSRYISCNSI